MGQKNKRKRKWDKKIKKQWKKGIRRRIKRGKCGGNNENEMKREEESG